MTTTEEQRTGYVRVLLKGGLRTGGRQVLDVKADSFGEAASMIECLPQQIISFEWISKGTFDSDRSYSGDARD